MANGQKIDSVPIIGTTFTSVAVAVAVALALALALAFLTISGGEGN